MFPQSGSAAKGPRSLKAWNFTLREPGSTVESTVPPSLAAANAGVGCWGSAARVTVWRPRQHVPGLGG